MAQVQVCPDTHTIRAAVAPGGFLPDEDWERVFKHAQTCDRCRKRLAKAQAEMPVVELAA